jgi:hypothetical protein
MLKILYKIIPGCFLLGASMELFMIKTGFYDIVIKKEGEKRAIQSTDDIRKLKRMQELNINIPK